MYHSISPIGQRIIPAHLFHSRLGSSLIARKYGGTTHSIFRQQSQQPRRLHRGERESVSSCRLSCQFRFLLNRRAEKRFIKIDRATWPM
jgi:hypothetical protein